MKHLSLILITLSLISCGSPKDKTWTKHQIFRKSRLFNGLDPANFILAVDSSKVQRSGTWEKSTSNRYTYPEHLFTENNGSSLEVQFQGTGLVLVLEAPNNTSYGGRGQRGASDGTVEVLVDGVKQIEATIKTMAREMTVVRNLPNSSHSAKIVYNGLGRCRILGFCVLQGPSGDLEMNIQSEEKSPLIDVRAIVRRDSVEIRNTLNRNWRNGATALAGLPVGEYDLEIRAFGWVTHRQKITIDDGIKTSLGTIVLKQDPATERNGFEYPAQGNQAVIKQGEGIQVVGPTSGVVTAKLRRQHGPAIFTREAAFSGNTLTVSGDTPPGLYDMILTTSTREERQAPRSVYVVKDYPENPAFMGWGHLDVWGQQRTEFIHRVVEMVNLMGVDMVLIANAVNAAYISGAMADLNIPYIINFGNHEFEGHEKWYGPDVHFFDYGPQIQILNFAHQWSNESLAKSMWDTREPAPIRIINSFEGDASCELLNDYNIKLVHYAHGNALGDWLLTGTRCNGIYLAGKYIRYMVFNNNQPSGVPGHHIDTDGLQEPELKLNAVFSPANDGTHQNVSAEVTNEYIPVPNGRLVFLMPAGSYEVDNGTIESEVTSDDGKYTIVTVRTPFPMNQKTTVGVLQSAKSRAQQPVQMTWPQITQQAKPWTRWWWMGSCVDKTNLTAAMEAYQKAGLGGLELTPIYGVKGYEDKFISYLSPQWMEMLQHTLLEGQRLDLGIDMATGTGWPFGGPFVDDENSSKYMAWQTFKLTKSQGLDQLVKYTQDPLVTTQNRKVDISELVQPVSENKNLQGLALDQVRFETELPLQALMAFSDDDKVVDLTEHVDKSGQVQGYEFSGNWDLFALFSGSHGKMVERAAPGGEGYVIDHFSGKAVSDYLNHFDNAFAQTDISGLRAFFNDSYEVDDAFGQADWTPGFFEDFRRLRGYDLRYHLKDLYAKGETEKSRRILCDYRETISDLLLTEFTEKWGKWAESKNAVIRNQSHGSPGNLLDLYAASGIPETEQGGGLLGIKLASSAANFSGRKLVSSEVATLLNEHFLASLGDVKKAVDFHFLGGVNHVVYHGTTYSPQKETWPGWMFYAPVHFGPSNSFWKDFHVLNNYVARSQSFLQNSQPDNDILLYFPYYDLISQPGKEMLLHIGEGISRLPLPNFTSAARLLLNKGYTLDYISDRQIKSLKCEKGMIQTHKLKYKTIVIPETEFIDLETFKTIVDLAEKGANVIIHNNFPADVKGFDHLQNSSDSLQSIIASLKLTEVDGTEINQAAVGKGKIFIGADLPELLTHIKINRETLVDNGLRFIRKGYGDGKVYFINNPGNNAMEGWISLHKDAISAALFNPMNNTFGAANLRKSDEGNIEVYLQLQPSESIILQTFTSSLSLDSPYYPYIKTSGNKKKIDGSWTITFIDGGSVLPEVIKTTELNSWTNLGDENTKSFSGTAAYLIDLDLDKEKQNDFLLELGQVCESAVIKFNNIEIASLISSPYQCVIPAEMIKEKNQLEIIVTNLMANRIAHLDKQNSNWKKFYNINFPARRRENRGADGLFSAQHWQPLKSGLLGPVTLTPVKKGQSALSAQ